MMVPGRKIIPGAKETALLVVEERLYQAPGKYCRRRDLRHGCLDISR